MTDAKEDLNLVIELAPTSTPEDVSKIKQELLSMPQTISSSYSYVPKSEAFEQMKKEMGKDMLSDDFPNPLQDIITINLKEEYINPESIKEIRSSVEKSSPAIDATYFQENVFSSGLDNLSKVLYGGMGLVALVFIVAITIIFTTTKLSLFANRHLIKNMELVGATSGFILRPFLSRSFRHGLLSSLIAIGIMAACFYSLSIRFPDISHLLTNKMTAGLVGGVIGIGILINIVTTQIIVKRYLRLRLNEMF